MKVLKVVFGEGAQSTSFVTFLSSPFGAGPFWSQQFTYGVVSEGVFAESLRKFCGKFAEIFKKYALVRQERARKFCGKLRNFAEILRKSFCNDPFPNDPISELLMEQAFRHFSR